VFSRCIASTGTRQTRVGGVGTNSLEGGRRLVCTIGGRWESKRRRAKSHGKSRMTGHVGPGHRMADSYLSADAERSGRGPRDACRANSGHRQRHAQQRLARSVNQDSLRTVVNLGGTRACYRIPGGGCADGTPTTNFVPLVSAPLAVLQRRRTNGSQGGGARRMACKVSRSTVLFGWCVGGDFPVAS